MSRRGLSSAFSRVFRSLFHGAPNRRARRAMRRSSTSTRPALEVLESRMLLSSYIVEDLGTGLTLSEANAINAQGQVVGRAATAGTQDHAYFWDAGQTSGKDLGTLGGTTSSALAINIHGEIVGYSDTPTESNHPFDIQPGGSMTDLTNAPPQSSIQNTLYSAKGVNDNGVIVGQGSFNLIDAIETSPYAYDPPSGTLNQLDASLGDGEATAVAGTRAVANLVNGSVTQAVVADINTPYSSVALPAIANQKDSFVYGLSAANASGTQFAVGEAIDTSNVIHAVLWTIPTNSHSATVSDLGNIAGDFSAKALGVNAEGDVVGKDQVDVGDSVAFLRNHDGSITNLNSLLPAGSGITLISATGINDAGQICADGYINGQEHAFRLTPVATAPPQATLTSAPDVSSAGSTTYTFVVTYSDANGIDAGTLANAATVTDLASGFSDTAALLSTSGTPHQLSATYQITAPGGTWGATDNGTYQIALNDKVVKTTSGQPLAGGTLGHFVAAINVPRGSISGTVFNDANDNGKHDSGEGGAPNLDVFLDLNDDGTFDTGDRITQTDANGAYSFAGLLPGTYRVKEYVSAPHTITAPSYNLYTVYLSAGQNVTGKDFGDWAAPEITDIAGQPYLGNAHGKTAQLDQPATVLHVTGVNFAPGDVFYFGNDEALAYLTNFQTDSYGVQHFDLQVPKLATTGAIVVLIPTVNNQTVNLTHTVLPTFTVDSYRNINGYTFDNDAYSLYTKDQQVKEKKFNFDELTAVFGSGQTYINPFGINTGIPNPLALLELAGINAIMPPTNGLCVGFSLSSARLSLGLEPSYATDEPDYQIGDFPATATGEDIASTVWQLSGPNGPSPRLDELIRQAHLEQTSVEFLNNYVGQVASNEFLGLNHLIDGVKSELSQGSPVLITFFGFQGSSTGHCVLAYNVEDGPNGSETLDIYDPDNEFLAQENQGYAPTDPYYAPSNVPGVVSGSLHRSRVDNSTIVFQSNGEWSYLNPSGDSASGDLGTIAMVPLSVFDSHSLLANDPASLALYLTARFVFGSASETQVTDSSGHTLLNADGSPNTDPNTKIPNAARYVADSGGIPLDLIQGSGNFLQTITGTGTGSYGADALGTDTMATLSGESTAKGQTDQFGLDPTNNKLTFIPGTTKNLNADLMMNAADGTVYVAQVSSSVVGGKQTLQFQDGQVEFQDADSGGDNPTESISLNFGHIDSTAAMEQSFSTGPIKLAAGDKVDVVPSDWNDLQDATATVTITHAGGTKTTSTITNGGKGYVVKAQEGVAMPSSTVASFSNQSAAGKSAVIDWGDNTTSKGTVTAAGADVTVAGAHTYTKQGYYSTRITLSGANGPIAQTTGEAIVTDANFSLASTNVSAFAGVPFSGTVATLTDPSSGDTASDFDVTINWGDGTTSAGTLQSTAAGKFDVLSSHTWAGTGTKSVSVTATENGSVSGQGQTLAIASNTNFSGTVARLQLPIPGSGPATYAATIDWGDGKTSTGTLTLQADGSYILSGSHAYAAGNKSYVTHFTLTGGPSAHTTSSAVVSAAVGTVTGTLFDDINGNGKMDAGEEGIPGQIVFIDKNNNGKLDSGEPSAVTNSSGVYTITNAPAGNIQVSEKVPIGFRIAAPASGSYTTTLSTGQTLSHLDLANTQLALISGAIFLDANGNGKRDASEPGQANQIVYLDLNNDGVLQPGEPTAITDATGAFSFTVNAGTYAVRLEPFSNFTITTPGGGAYRATVGVGSTNSSGLFGEQPLPSVESPPPPPHLPPPPPSPAPPPSHSPAPSPSPTPPPSHSPAPSPSPTPPPTLHTPSLLALFDSLLHGVETVNSNGTETVVDSLFGIPFLMSVYDSAGKLEHVTMLGFDVTTLFELL